MHALILAVVFLVPVTWDAITQAPPPASCTAIPVDRIPDTRLLAGVQPLTRNPWTGNTRRLVGLVREGMYGSPEMPDALLDARQANAFVQRSADGIDAAHVTFYEDANGTTARVYALQFAGRAPERPAAIPASEWFQNDDIVVRVFGDGGACLDAIRDRLRN